MEEHTTPQDTPQPDNAYVIDTSRSAEMARLTNQARVLTSYMGGLFPRNVDLSRIRMVLDIGCGPGDWALDVAQTYPGMEVTGIDLSTNMIEYAQTSVEAQRLSNAHFQVMDLTKRFTFRSETFDFVNARLIAFLTRTAWARLLQECMRIARPKGIIRLTENDGTGPTNSAAIETFNDLYAAAQKRAGSGFSPHARHLGITPLLARFLQDAGAVNIQQEAFALNYSYGMPAYHPWRANLEAGMLLGQPYFIKWGVATQQELDILYQQALAEIRSEDFCGVAYYLSVWGEKR